MSSNEGPGTGGFYQVKPQDWEDLNRVFRQVCNRLDSIEGRRGAIAFEADLDFNEHKGTNAADPTENADLVTKQYADATYGAAAQSFQLSIQGSNPLNLSNLGGLPKDVGSIITGTHANRLTDFPPDKYPV